MAQDRSEKSRIAIIGSGHIACAFAQGLVVSGIHARELIVSGPSAVSNRALKALGVRRVRDSHDAVLRARWIFIAVKPAVVPVVLKELKRDLKDRVVISFAAGIRLRALQRLVPEARVGRVIPNIPISVQQGVCGYFRGTLKRKKTQNSRNFYHVLAVSSH